METNSNDTESLKKLGLLVAYLSPVFSRHGFHYEAGESGHGHGELATGFFVHEKIKIGLIYRKLYWASVLGGINYEGKERNLSHDDMFKALSKEGENKLLFNPNPSQLSSYTYLDEGVEKALLLDLETVILPFIANASVNDINTMMNSQPKWWES